MLSYYEILLEVKLKEEVYFSKAHEMLSSFFNKTMLLDNYLKEVHTNTSVKLYSYSNLYPTEQDGTYKPNKKYKIELRSLDAEFICAMQYALNQINDSKIKVINVKFIKKQQAYNSELITLTPALFTFTTDVRRANHWQIGDDIKQLEQQMINNLMLKYNTLCKYKNITNETIQPDKFFYSISIPNKIPIYIPYKKGLLLSNKFKIQLKEDANSQTLATVALGAGLGEKNSIGMGFCVCN